MMLRQGIPMAKQEAVDDQSLHATLGEQASREALAAPWYKISACSIQAHELMLHIVTSCKTRLARRRPCHNRHT